MTAPEPSHPSPPWSSTAKLVVALTFLVLVGALLVRFRNIIGPLLLAFILSYVLHPLISSLSKSTRLSWRSAVNLVYLIMVIFLVALISLTGFAVVQQLQSLVGIVQRFVVNLPELVENLSLEVYQIGPFRLDLSQYLDLGALSEQLLSLVQPMLGRVGNLVGTLATSAAATLGWGVFILLISYFVAADAGEGFPEAVLSVEIPGYQADINRLGRELGRIWNAFLRGQLLIFSMTVLASVTLMTILGVRFALGLAILAGFARFVPYIGPLTTWIVTVLVVIFQGQNYFGLSPLEYAGLVVGAALLLDQIFDNIVTPRLLGHTLGVHPAAVLVAAIVATNLIGIIGLLLAAPVLATLQLFGRYAVRKMFDLEAWPETELGPSEFTGTRLLREGGKKILSWWQRKRLRRRGEVDDVERNPRARDENPG